MPYFIFIKYLRSLEEFRKNPHVKIPPKSPCANFQSHGKFKNLIFNSKILFLRFRPGQPYGPLGLWPSRPRWPLSSRGPKPPLLAHLARASVASSRKYVFSFGSRLPSGSLLSHLSVKWAWVGSFVFLPRRPTVAASSHRLQPPRAARPPTSRCQSRSSLHALIPPLICPLIPSSSRPAINGVKTITAGRFPLPRHGVPLPGHYKGTRSTPRPSPHSPRPQLLAFDSATSIPPSASSVDCSPRRSIVSDPPPPPLAVGEAHRRPLSLFPQPR
jgi:hypothetical protein